MMKPQISKALRAVGRTAHAEVACRKSALLIGLAILMACRTPIAAADLRGDRLHAESPVVVSYSWPEQRGNHDPYKILMRSPNIIDILPTDPHASPAVRQYWTARGKILLHRVYPFRKHRTAGELYDYFANSMAGAAGISIDEVVAQQLAPAKANLLATTLRRLRKRFANKYIFVWDGSRWTKDNASLLRTIRDTCDMLILEVYIPQRAASRSEFAAFHARVSTVERLAPGILSKTIIGVGAYPAMREGSNSNFSAYLAKQVRYMRQDPALRTLPGLAIYAPIYLSAQEQAALDNVIMEQAGIAARVSRETLTGSSK